MSKENRPEKKPAKELPQPSTEKLAEAANKWLVPNMQKKPKKEE